jgi:hypothetical protein
MKDDLDAIEGTQEQKDILAQIDAGTIPSPDVYSGGKEYHLSKISDEDFNYDITPNNDGKERQELSNTMKERGIYADFDESKKETIDYIPYIYDNIKRDFPKMNEAMQTIGYSDYLPDNEGAYFNPINHEIIYNKNIFMSEKNIEEYLTRFPGYFASTNKRSIINHEFGHAIEKLIMQLSNNDDIVKNEIKILLEENGFKSRGDVIRGISEYAADPTYHDTIAEAVSDYLSEKEPREISKLIYNKLISLYRRFV